MYKKTIPSPVGNLTLTSDGKYLTGLFIEGQKYFLYQQDDAVENNDLDIFLKVEDWLTRYFEHKNPDPKEIPIKLLGTEFRKSVWKELQKIPYGTTTTYKDLGKALKKDTISLRAVGNAVGHNPISIIIPCHRVIGSNGSLTGYAAGTLKKAYLLKLEQNDNKTYTT